MMKKPITDRQRQIIYLISYGYSNKEIAEKLGITDSGVRNHVVRAGRRLPLKDGYKNRTYITCYCLRKGLIK
jgi:DNA-binding NarL/FixJ family response regulator